MGIKHRGQSYNMLNASKSRCSSSYGRKIFQDYNSRVVIFYEIGPWMKRVTSKILHLGIHSCFLEMCFCSQNYKAERIWEYEMTRSFAADFQNNAINGTIWCCCAACRGAPTNHSLTHLCLPFKCFFIDFSSMVSFTTSLRRNKNVFARVIMEDSGAKSDFEHLKRTL